MGLPLGVIPAAGAAVSGISNLGSAASGISNSLSNLFGGKKQPTFAKPLKITLKLGDFIFQDMEVPEVIPFHAAQRLSVKKMIGGVRQIDAMGTDFAPITWSGTIWPYKKLSAMARAKQLELMRDTGQPLNLSWDARFYQVYISDFAPDYRFGRIPYTITLEVLADLAQPAQTITNPTIDDLAGGGISLANSILSFLGKLSNLSSSIMNGIAAVSALIGAVELAVYAASSNVASASSAAPTSHASPAIPTGTPSSISTLVGAPPSVVNPIMQTVVAAVNALASLIAQIDLVLAGSPGIAGVVPGQSGALSATAFNSYLAASQAQVYMLQLKTTMNVLLGNLQQINSSVRVITVSGGNLYDVAAKEYGDPLGAELIMEANGLLDPTITGNVTLIIPPYNAAAVNGGILAV